MQDLIYQMVPYQLSEIKHNYGKNVHILADSYLLSHLALLCSEQTFQPTINELVETLYSGLVKIIINQEFPKKKMAVATRMHAYHPEAVFEGELVDPDQKTVTVNLARAGTFPSHVCYTAFNYVLNPKLVRQDHISINRETDAKEKVVGAKISGHKIGGSIDDSIVVFPDPMGATGGTLVSALNIYKNEVQGKAKKFIALHLIVTPEYLKKVRATHPDLTIYAVRLDRGLSKPPILQTTPGTCWDEERGLNDKQYIVPGGGGFGEILNNSFV